MCDHSSCRGLYYTAFIHLLCCFPLLPSIFIRSSLLCSKHVRQFWQTLHIPPHTIVARGSHFTAFFWLYCASRQQHLSLHRFFWTLISYCKESHFSVCCYFNCVTSVHIPFRRQGFKFKITVTNERLYHWSVIWPRFLWWYFWLWPPWQWHVWEHMTRNNSQVYPIKQFTSRIKRKGRQRKVPKPTIQMKVLRVTILYPHTSPGNLAWWKQTNATNTKLHQSTGDKTGDT
jgi:hypothetical protein